jgi:predicted ABC-type ATPase
VAVARVAERVKLGGHNVPEETVRRRYHAGLRNFFTLYGPLATSWQVIDNRKGHPRVIAMGTRRKTTTIRDEAAWKRVLKGRANGT